RSLRPEAALRLGLVDDVVPEPAALEAACSLAARLAREPRALRALTRARAKAAGSAVERWLLERSPLGRAVFFRRVRRRLRERTGGQHPVAERIVDLLARWAARGPGAAADLEPHLFADLVTSDASRRL